jgi:L-asparaginase / beta-aspartyl-peptidase
MFRINFLLLLLALTAAVIIGSLSFEADADFKSNMDNTWAIALHGGAGVISRNLSDDRVQEYYDSLEEALEIGEDILKNGGSALDAVEQVVRYLEDNPLFNAGKGSVFTNEGKHELDAAIMDGSTLAAGALTGLTTVKNPVSLARHVMENSRHIFFSGSGAEHYADQTDVKRVDNDWFFTQRRYEQWQRSQQEDGRSGNLNRLNDEVYTFRYGTVGASALDQNGRLAAATSTGGMTNKMFGRVGDVPIIGAGTYANDLVAVSATGWGEQIMRNVSAHTIASYMEFSGGSLEESIDFLLNERLNPGDAGFIAVDKEGNVSLQMNTVGMFRAGSNAAGFREVAIWE